MENLALTTLLLPFIGALVVSFSPQRRAAEWGVLFAALTTLCMLSLISAFYQADKVAVTLTLVNVGDVALFGLVIDRVSTLILFVVLGSLGGQLDVEPKRWFALGTISASFLWFFGLAILAAWLAPRLRTAKSQRIINLVVGCVMWFIALQLARDGIAHAQALFS
ncbi:LysE family transporter [Escherichia sp. R-CC3]